MKRINLSLISFMILVLLMLSAGSAFSQDIDISAMDHEQLLRLLKQIMEKLENEDAPVSETPETPFPIMTPPADNTPGPGPEARIFRIYENKKLILERMPDYYFTQVRPNDEDDDNTTGPSDPGRKKEEGQYIDEKENCMNWCREFITQVHNYALVSCWYDYCGF